MFGGDLGLRVIGNARRAGSNRGNVSGARRREYKNEEPNNGDFPSIFVIRFAAHRVTHMESVRPHMTMDVFEVSREQGYGLNATTYLPPLLGFTTSRPLLFCAEKELDV